MQSNSYRPERGYAKIIISPYFATLIAAQITAALFYAYKLPEYCLSIVYFAAACPWTFLKRKCPLKFTKRIWRIIAMQTIVLFLLCYFVGNAFFVASLPLITLLSLIVCLPIDNAIAKRYLKKASIKLEKSGVTVIAVTGSYGKTSVKDMLTSLLDDSVSPVGSCNTPLGIASFINKTDFYYVKYLVLEFGARQKGDILELCKLYKPSCGIITGVCAQHLSTFKTLDNVVSTKRELVEYLSEKGFCVLNDSDEIASGFVNSGNCRKILSHNGLSVNIEKVDFSGTALKVGYGKISRSVILPQVTEYVADTFALCLQTALNLKQSFTKTISRADDVKQTPHRMELIKTERGYILDDSYNGSVAGIESCVKTLSNFSCVKTVITQGLVECGKQRKQMNIQCGRLLGGACDVAIVLGKNSKFLASGLSETNCKTVFAKNLKRAVELAQPYIQGGILLFQNDLPDV